MEAIILIIIILVILVYTSFNFKASFVVNNKNITFSIKDQTSSDTSDM